MKTVCMDLSWGSRVRQHRIGLAKLFVTISLDTLKADEINFSYSHKTHNCCNLRSCRLQYRIQLRSEKTSQRREPGIKQVVRICIYLIKIFFYLIHLKISTARIDVGILGEKLFHGDAILVSNFNASVSRHYSVNFGAQMTGNTKTNYLDEKNIQMRLSTMIKKDCSGLDLLRQGVNWCTEGWWLLGSPGTIGICIKVVVGAENESRECELT